MTNDGPGAGRHGGGGGVHGHDAGGHGGGGPHGPPPGEKAHFFDRKQNVDRFFLAFYALCAVVLVAELFVDRHTEHPWEGLFGFYGLWGFASFWFLVLVAKQMRKVLMRSEDYYGVD